MKYISYKESKIEEQKRKQNNERYIKQKIETEKQYFQNMFKTIDKNIKLDEEQIKIILTDEDYQMVIAGAGAGKTTTITAKVNYLIEKQNIKDEEILIISFTNKAVNELKERINKDFKHNVKIQTFHKFGYDIIKNNTKTPPKIETENGKIIEKYIEQQLINNPKQLKTFLDFFIYYFEISEEYIIMNDYEIYNNYKNKTKYPTLKQKIEYITTNTKTSEQQNKTLKQEYTQNINETKIANYLYMNNIEYQYKKQYPYKETYIPDFTITYKNQNYYIEQFNINKINKFKYKNNIKKIKKIHKKHKTKLIEIYEGDILEQLQEQLKKYKIEQNEKQIEEIFKKLTKENDKTYKKFTNLCKTFITLFKSKGYQEEDLNKINIKNKRTKLFINFMKGLYEYYQTTLIKQNKIDFDDMINLANKIITTKQNIKLKYKYIIIDEYQDISECRYNLIKNISQKLNNKIMVVGDDWQCIYSFAASNINLFTQFKENVQYCEIQKITKTYRNSQELIDIAGQFIQQNNSQIKKHLISNKTLINPITILKYKPKQKIKKLIESLNYIIKKYGEQKNILILGRYTFDKNEIIDNKNIKEQNNKIIYTKYPNTQIDYMTIHSAKGLGYDNIIIINAKDETLGFPSKIKTDPILEQLITIDKTIKYSEERRLFYVALTRTKNEVIILTPKKNSSIFIKEIKNIKKQKLKYKPPKNK